MYHRLHMMKKKKKEKTYCKAVTAFLTSSINSFLLNERGSSSQRWRTMTRICLLLILRLGFPSVEGSLQQHMRKAGAVLRTLYIFTWLPPFFHKHRCRIRSRNFRNNRKLNTNKYIRLSLLLDWQLKPPDCFIFISESSDIWLDHTNPVWIY